MTRVALIACVVLACGPKAGPGAFAPVPAGSPYDVVIEGGRIVDGTGNAWFYGDVAITGDRIARIAPPGTLREARTRERVDARGLVVAPGFIDIQAHSRDALLIGDGRVVGKVTQGVTTEIMGEGWTNAPVNDHVLQAADPSDPSDTAHAGEFRGNHGFDAWLRAMERHGMSVNAGSFLGAATIRIYAKGMAAGAPTAAELDTMRAVTRRAMADGAFGVASALIYPPGNFATTEELVEIAKVMAPDGGVYITHMRSAGRDLSPEGRRPAQLAEGGGRHRQDRLGAGKGFGRAGRYVSIRRRRDEPHGLLAAVGLRGRQALRQSPRFVDTRAHQGRGAE